MVVRAVIFDFYGTLVVNPSADVHRQRAAAVAAALGVPAGDYYAALTSTFTERATGSCGDLVSTLHWLAGRCGHQPTETQLAEASALRRSIEASYARAIRPDAETTLASLQALKLGLGLLSDCTHELPEVWPSLPIAGYFDATVFSIEAGVRKPHPDLYAAVTRALHVDPSECLYVGDGGSGELTGARAAGLTAFRLTADDAADAIVYDVELAWTGPTIRTLSEVPALVTTPMLAREEAEEPASGESC